MIEGGSCPLHGNQKHINSEIEETVNIQHSLIIHKKLVRYSPTLLVILQISVILPVLLSDTRLSEMLMHVCNAD